MVEVKLALRLELTLSVELAEDDAALAATTTELGDIGKEKRYGKTMRGEGNVERPWRWNGHLPTPIIDHKEEYFGSREFGRPELTLLHGYLRDQVLWLSQDMILHTTNQSELHGKLCTTLSLLSHCSFFPPSPSMSS